MPVQTELRPYNFQMPLSAYESYIFWMIRQKKTTPFGVDSTNKVGCLPNKIGVAEARVIGVPVRVTYAVTERPRVKFQIG